MANSFNWDAYEEAAPEATEKSDSFDWGKFEEVKPEVSKLESLVRGGAQGLSFGFADEITGGAEALWEAAKGDPKTFGELYKQALGESRAKYKEAEEANPATYTTGQVGGAIVPALLTGGASTAATLGGRVAAGALGGLAQGAAQGLGSSEADLTQGDVSGALRDTAIGAGTGAVIGGALPAIGAGLKKGAGYAAEKLGNVADDLRVRSLDLTSAQRRKLPSDAGQTLKPYVKAFDTAEDISGRLTDSKEAIGSTIDDVLAKLDAKGVTASVDNVVDALDAKVAELQKFPGNEATIKQIQNQIDNLYVRGESQIPISGGESAKRNFSDQVNYFSSKADQKAPTHVAKAFREEVERSAAAADPELSGAFKQAKQAYGSLAPIEEAAAKRVGQQAGGSFGGLKDMATGAYGAAAGDPTGGIASAAARKIIGPRIASTGAVGADKLSKFLTTAPERFGKFAQVLQRASQRGPTSLAATHFVLQQTNPEYREQFKGIESNDEQEQE